MTAEPKEMQNALDQLADALVDDILGASDEEILAEAAEDHDDLAKAADDMRALFARVSLGSGKAKLAAAKEAVARARQEHSSVRKFDRAGARRQYEKIVANNSDLAAKLTLAARKGEGQSDRDIESALEDLAELGAFDDESDEDGKT